MVLSLRALIPEPKCSSCSGQRESPTVDGQNPALPIIRNIP